METLIPTTAALSPLLAPGRRVAAGGEHRRAIVLQMVGDVSALMASSGEVEVRRAGMAPGIWGEEKLSDTAMVAVFWTRIAMSAYAGFFLNDTGFAVPRWTSTGQLGICLLIVVITFAANIQGSEALGQTNATAGLAYFLHKHEKSLVIALVILFSVVPTVIIYKEKLKRWFTMVGGRIKTLWKCMQNCFENVKSGWIKVKYGFTKIRDLGIKGSSTAIISYMIVMLIFADVVHVITNIVSESYTEKQNTSAIVIVEIIGYVATYFFTHARLLLSAESQRSIADRFPGHRQIEDIFSFLMGLVLFVLSKLQAWIEVQHKLHISKTSVLLIASGIGFALQVVAYVIAHRFFGLVLNMANL